MKYNFPHYAASMMSTTFVLLISQNLCLGQSNNAPAMPSPVEGKNYYQLVRDLKNILSKPSGTTGYEGFFYSKSVSISPKGGLVVMDYLNNEYRFKFTPITIKKIKSAFLSSDNLTIRMHFQEPPLQFIYPNGETMYVMSAIQNVFPFSTPEGAQAALDAVEAIQNCTTPNIDWAFLGDVEGHGITEGYVPKKNGVPIQKSGVTIATGVDLGQHDEKEINTWDIPYTLKQKLLPYKSPLKGNNAVTYLAKHPLSMKQKDADSIDKAIQKKQLPKLMNDYDAATTGAKFVELPTEAQTVILSVLHQFGSPLSSSAKRFWNDVIQQKWDLAQDELKDFNGNGKPSEYQSRREKEAALLAKLGTDDITP